MDFHLQKESNKSVIKSLVLLKINIGEHQMMAKVI